MGIFIPAWLYLLASNKRYREATVVINGPISSYNFYIKKLEVIKRLIIIKSFKNKTDMIIDLIWI